MTNWKTTLVGLGVGAGNLFLSGTNWKNILLSIGFAAFGAVAKDFDKTNSPAPIAVAQPTQPVV